MHPDHLKELVALAQRKKIPILADEVGRAFYGDLISSSGS